MRLFRTQHWTYTVTTHSWLTLALAFFVTRPGRGSMRPSRPGVSALSVVALCNKDQSTTLNEYSRLVVYILTPGQHVTTHPWLRGSFQGHTRIIAVTTRSWLEATFPDPKRVQEDCFPTPQAQQLPSATCIYVRVCPCTTPMS